MEKSAEELYAGNEGWEDFPQTHTWTKALEFAKEKHKGQTRDEGTPYYEHIRGTMEILIKEANTREDEVLTVAALHDILEDTDCTYNELKEKFGQRVADCVQLLTLDWENGQTFEEYAKGIFENQDFKYARKIKLADRLNNLRSLPKTNNDEKIKRKIEETEKYIVIYDKQAPKILMDKIKAQLDILKAMQNSKKNLDKQTTGIEHEEI